MYKSLKNLFFCSLLFILTVACADTSNLESALQIAQNEAFSLATANAELVDQNRREVSELSTRTAQEANAAATESALILAEAQGAAQESIAEAKATGDAISAAATANALPNASYDERVYGVIDDLDLNGVVVRWWHNHSGRELLALENIVDEFNATNNFGIIIEPTNEGNLDTIFEKLLVGFATGDIPGIVESTPGQMVLYHEENGLIALDPYLNHPTFGFSNAELEDIYPPFLQSGRLIQADNQLYGMPLDRSMELLLVNQNLLDQLDIVEPPRNLREWTSMACQASRARLTGMQIQPSGKTFSTYALASGSNIFDIEETTFKYDSAGVINYVTALSDLVGDRCAVVSEAQFGDQRAFVDGETLFIQTSSENLPVITAEITALEEPFEWTVEPIPYVGYEPAQLLFGENLIIPESSPEEQLAAWIFLRYFAAPEQQSKWVEASHGFPIRKSTSAFLDRYLSENPSYKKAFDFLKYGHEEIPVAGFNIVESEAQSIAEAIFIDNENIEIALIQLNNTANQQLFR